MVTHDPQVAAYADRQIHLRDGRLVDELPVFENIPAGIARGLQ